MTINEYLNNLSPEDRRVALRIAHEMYLAGIDEDVESVVLDPRLAFDPAVSNESPVVKGTRITVDYIVNLMAEGILGAEVLRIHPELTEDDLRVVWAYHLEHW